MDTALARYGIRIVTALAATAALCAAGPLTPSANSAELAAPLGEQTLPAKALKPQGTTFQAAPVPDQDVDGPADTTKPAASLSPKLLSQKSLFQGDGYYYASSEQSTLDGRRAGVPGLGLSVPVK
jgi:hypothetical protein